MSARYSGHKYDINHRPDNCDLAKHFQKTYHDLETDLEVSILEHGIQDADKRRQVEDRYICKLQTYKGSGINSDLGPYAREMYESWKSLTKLTS